MDAKITNEKKMTLEAIGKDLDTANDGNISVKITSSGGTNVSDELRLLESATCAYFLRAFPRIVKEDRVSVVEQYINRVGHLLNLAAEQFNDKD